MFLSTKEGIPIAKILHNRKYKTINLVLDTDEDLHEDIYEDNTDIDPFDYITEDDIEKRTNSKATLKRNGFVIPPSILEEAYEKAKKNFIIHEGMLEPMPNLRNTRDVLYVAGPSASGKSTYIGKYLTNYLQTYPDNKIIIVSKLSSDIAFDHLNPIRIRIDDGNFIDNPIDPSEFSDSCVVFDDIDTIKDQKLLKEVQKLRDDCLEVGRHHNISVCATSHLLMNYKATKTMINESHTVTFFPQSGSTYQINRFLKEYAGLNKKQSEHVLGLPSRWVTLHKNYPNYIMYEKGAYLVSNK